MNLHSTLRMNKPISTTGLIGTGRQTCHPQCRRHEKHAAPKDDKTMKPALCFAALTLVVFSTQAPAQSAPPHRDSHVDFQTVQARTLDDVITQLESAGFSIDDIGRTFLGRIRITASNQTMIREIVMSRATGEIMSDVARAREADRSDGAGPSQTGSAASNGVAGGNTTRSREAGSSARGGGSDNRSGNGRASGNSGNNAGAGAGNRSN